MAVAQENKLHTLNWYKNKKGHTVQVEALEISPEHFVYLSPYTAHVILLDESGITIDDGDEYSIDWTVQS